LLALYASFYTTFGGEPLFVAGVMELAAAMTPATKKPLRTAAGSEVAARHARGISEKVYNSLALY